MLGNTALQSKNTDTVDLGVINDKAIYMPLIAYPPAARAARIGGIVEVRVFINRAGNVVKVNVISGPKPLRRVVIASARKSRFLPNLGDCKTCRYVTGILVYKFNLDDALTRQKT